MIRHLLAPHVPQSAAAIGVRRRLEQLDGVVLTFDDGPHPRGTPAVLKLLADAGAQAAFFMVGEQVQRRPQLAAEVLAQGHLVALHGYRHRLQARLPAASVRDDVRRGAAAIEDATGVTPRWHRPPYGVYSAAGLACVQAGGMTPLLWSRWGKDWRKFTTPRRIARRATHELRSGDVILLHDADFYSSRGSDLRTVAALELILAELGKRRIGTVLPV